VGNETTSFYGPQCTTEHTGQVKKWFISDSWVFTCVN